MKRTLPEKELKKPVKNFFNLKEQTKEQRKLVRELKKYQMELEYQNHELDRAKQLAEKQKRKYEDLFNFSPTGYFTFDREGHIIEINFSATQLLGLKKDYLIGRFFHIYIVREHWEVFNKFFRDVFETGIRQSCELKLTDKNGVIFYAQLEGIAFNEGEIDSESQCRMAVIDITERKIAEEALKRNSEELIFNKKQLEKKSLELAQVFIQLAKSERNLRALNLNKDKLFAIIAHDLKNPFSALISYCQILLADFDKMSNEEAKQIHLKLNNTATRINDLLHNLLKWAVIQFGKNEYTPSRLLVYSVVEESLKLLQDSASNKGIKIINKVKPEHAVLADSNMLDSILQNLITNAIKFSHKKGSVIIESEIIRKDVVIKISDTGEGIKNELLATLFKKDRLLFSNKGTALEKGSGLGLILCKELVEIQGGKIWAENQCEKGGRFSFTLPIYNCVKKIGKMVSKKSHRNFSAA
jgi:PAS domain S-box-containing protein